MHLFWGGRLAQSDFLYEHQLREWLADQRLSGLHTAFSRCPEPAYVQDTVREERVLILALLASQAQILVCGGRRMAGDVACGAGRDAGWPESECGNAEEGRTLHRGYLLASAAICHIDNY
jgi:NAD(P)H-flavin reductase